MVSFDNMPENNEQLIALSSLTLGQKAQIMAFSFDASEGERIQNMGFSPGEQLEVVRLPQEGPIEMKIRGYFVSLSKQEADRIKVKLLS